MTHLPTHDSRIQMRSVTVALFWLLMAQALHAAGSLSAGASAPQPVIDDFEKGKHAIKQKEYPAAVRFFEEALAAQPNNPDVLNMLAFSERKSGHLNEAFQYYAKALTLRPRFPEAREYLAEAHLQAAIKEYQTLKSYGADGKEEVAELSDEFKETVETLK